MRYSRPLHCVLAVLSLSLQPIGSAQTLQAVRTESAPSPSVPKLEPSAYLHYLLALRFASEGIPYAALHEAAASLRQQRNSNPAAALAFQLIAQQRQDVHVRLCCVRANILQARFSPDGTRVMTVLDDSTIRIWDAHSGAQMLPPMQHGGDVLAAAWSVDGRRIASTSRDSKVHLWDAATGRPVRAPLVTDKPLTHLALSPDGQRILGSHDGAVFLLNAATGEAVSPQRPYHDDVNVVAFSDDGKHALVGTNDDMADLLDPVTLQRQHRLPQGNAVFSAVFSRDSRYALLASEDHTAHIWDAETGKTVGSAFAHSDAVSRAVFNPDATKVLTLSFDHTARVWNAQTGQALTPPLQHSTPILDGGFSADGEQVFTRDREGTIHFWSATTGEAIAVPLHPGGVHADVQFSPVEGMFLLTGNTVEIRDMPPSDPAPAWLPELADFEASRSRFNQGSAPDRAAIEQLRAELLRSREADRWTQFGKWYFATPGERTVSPWSAVKLQDYVDRLIRLGSPDAFACARAAAAGHPAWLLKIDAAQKAAKANR